MKLNGKDKDNFIKYYGIIGKKPNTSSYEVKSVFIKSFTVGNHKPTADSPAFPVYVLKDEKGVDYIYGVHVCKNKPDATDVCSRCGFHLVQYNNGEAEFFSIDNFRRKFKPLEANDND